MDLPVLAPFEREGVGHERFRLLPDLVCLFGEDLVFGIVAGLWFVCPIRVDSLGKGNLAGARSREDSVGALLHGLAQFLAAPIVPSPPERRLRREALESEIAAERGVRSQVVVERGLVPAVDLSNE